MYKAALFDLDGVIFDTEPQYSVFWESQLALFYPEAARLAREIKGSTLPQIYDKYFGDHQEEQAKITERLDEFEQNMSFDYVKGFRGFMGDLRRNGFKTAVVTSSNRPKMTNVYRSHPDFCDMFDCVLTSEDFSESKPSPDCYLKGAERLGLRALECIGFEDSFNGLKSVRASGMTVVGLSTTNPADDIRPLSDVVIGDYEGLGCAKMLERIRKVVKTTQ